MVWFCSKCGTKFDTAAQASFTKTLQTSDDELPRGTIFAGRYKILNKRNNFLFAGLDRRFSDPRHQNG